MQTSLQLAQDESLNLVILAKQAQEYAEYVRRHLHENPELGWEEEKTIAFLLSEIHSFQVAPIYRMSIKELEGGFYVDLDFHGCKERHLFRADIDALPITESEDHLCRSKVDGVMHACGHDFHAAMLLTALKSIVEKEFHSKQT